MKASRNSGQFSAVEEAFFREGSQMETTEPLETFADLDEGFQRPSIWQRLLGKKR